MNSIGRNATRHRPGMPRCCDFSFAYSVNDGPTYLPPRRPVNVGYSGFPATTRFLTYQGRQTAANNRNAPPACNLRARGAAATTATTTPTAPKPPKYFLDAAAP